LQLRVTKSALFRTALAACALSGVLALAASRAGAQLTDPVQRIGIRPDLLKDVGIDQKLNQQIPLDLTFRDENGKTVQIGKYFGHKPVVLSLVYYDCPMLCTQVLSGMEASLRNISLNIGEDYNVVTVSIDPNEDAKLAHVKQELYTGVYGRPGASEGWHFLTGDEPQIKKLADSVGFRYAYDPDSKQFARWKAKFRNTFTGSPIPRAMCGWVSWTRPKAESALRSIQCCSSATTMIQRPANTACWFRA
jgi:cytochrome oxidase Cu insertion factor (SCO1/SenC/PrrC family)